MIRHVACFKFRTHQPEANCKALIDALSELPNQVPEILNWSSGCNLLHIDLAYDAALVGDFADRDALLRYFRHPATKGVLDQIDRVCASRVSVDFELN